MNSMKKFLRENWVLFAVASCTLGLAPFVPEPHIWDKLKRIFLGTQSMAFIDWVDVLLHGTPWVLLFISIGLNLSRIGKK